ncbi:MAG: hypothetical protein QG657_3630 [Acidobacteriota bacterium]|nr:hypothetical protein [Acidobacteriota bacterium]
MKIIKEDTMNYLNLSDVTDQFVMELGPEVLYDMDTPSFMRKEYNIVLDEGGKSPSAGKIIEPDEKIIQFITVIKRRDLVLNAA